MKTLMLWAPVAFSVIDPPVATKVCMRMKAVQSRRHSIPKKRRKLSRIRETRHTMHPDALYHSVASAGRVRSQPS